jgi:hypothetical protein
MHRELAGRPSAFYRGQYGSEDLWPRRMARQEAWGKAKRWKKLHLGVDENVTVKLNIFVLSAGLAIVIVLLTVSFNALRAALANPVDSLRYE